MDDEIDICYLLSGMLKQKNMFPTYVNSLSEATIALQKEVPEMLFLDNHLPDGLGIEYIQYVKKNYPDVRIVMITAHDSLIERKKAYNDGADFFLGKPLSRELIYNTVEKLIPQHPM